MQSGKIPSPFSLRSLTLSLHHSFSHRPIIPSLSVPLSNASELHIQGGGISPAQTEKYGCRTGIVGIKTLADIP